MRMILNLKKIFALKCFYLISLLWPAHTLQAAIQISENTATRLAFTWTLDRYDTTSFTSANGARATAITVAGSNSQYVAADSTVVPLYSFFVGVPAQGSIALNVNPSDIVTLNLHHGLAKKPRKATDAAGPLFNDDASWLSRPQYATAGGRRVVKLALRPVGVRQRGGEIQICRRVSIVITFPAAPFMPSQKTGRSDYVTMLRNLILNYDVSCGWYATAPGRAKKTAESLSAFLNANTLSWFEIGDGHSGINEGTINENGILKLTWADLQSLAPQQPININSIRLFGSHKTELPVGTPAASQIPDGVAEVPLLRIDRNGNGLLDSEDMVLAYVTGASDWRFDSTQYTYTYALNHYTDQRRYWVLLDAGVTSGLSMQPAAGLPPAGDTTLTDSKQWLLIKQPRSAPHDQNGNPLEGTFEWVMVNLHTVTMHAADSIRDISFNFTQLNPLLPVRLRVPATYLFNGSFAVNFAGTPVCANCLDNTWYPVLPDSLAHPRVTVTYTCNSDTGTFGLQQVQLTYFQRLDMTGLKSLTVFSPEVIAGRPVTYRITGLPGQLVYVFKIQNNEQAITLLDTTRDSSLAFNDFAGRGIRYFVCTAEAFQAAPRLSPYQRRSDAATEVYNLHNSATDCDYLIVTPADFKTQALRLAAHKKSIGRFLYPKVVDMADIYREFSGGIPDRAALRNFLVFAHKGWNNFGATRTCDYVVLMGTGHYDYKNIVATRTNFIPSAEFNTDCYESYFSALDSGSGAAAAGLFLGRLPCQTAAEAGVMVDKIIETESLPAGADYSAWRDRMLLIADDDRQGPALDGITHYLSSEHIARDILAQNGALDLRKTYLFDYPWNDQYEKPAVNRAIVNAFNNGLAYVNYFGHGADVLLADEHVFTLDDVAALRNSGQYPLFSAFSCSVGRFDDPGASHVSLCEALLKAAHAGAVVCLASTRAAYPT
ncbi:MAG: C25 family cysteine peptidase, partial [Chitinivibrionales bacterium]|nr:C25 family cysteine peptidase [Chitinivibrionales bacterium]